VEKEQSESLYSVSTIVDKLSGGEATISKPIGIGMGRCANYEVSEGDIREKYDLL